MAEGYLVCGSIFIRLACGSVVGHGLQHSRSRLHRGRARTLRKRLALNVAFSFDTLGALLSDPEETCEG